MPSLHFATRQQIIDSADTLYAQNLIPELIRRLIRESAPNAEMTVPTEEGIRLPGYDGLVFSQVQMGFVPEGHSVWEFGVGKNPGAKANEDYKKRASNFLHVNPAETTFVFVTPREWPKAENWRQLKAKEGIFKAVKVLTIDNLMDWLSQCPRAHAWLSERLELPVDGVRSLDGFWDSWKTGNPSDLRAFLFYPTMVLAGREKQVEELVAKLKEPNPQIIRISSREEDEVLPFVAAALIQGPRTFEKQELLDRVCVFDTEDAFRYYSKHGKGLTLIPRFLVDPIYVRDAVGQGHHVILPYSGYSRTDQPLVLEPLDTAILEQFFLDQGRGEGSAYWATRLSSSLTAFRRMVLEGERPAAWANVPEAQILARLALIGAWDGHFEEDKALISKWTGLTYPAIEELLLRLNMPTGDLAEKQDLAWRFKSKEDAWGQLHGMATLEIVEDFCRLALEVLTEHDPNLDLDPAGKIQAALEGRRQRYSSVLRDSLAESLALMLVLHQRKGGKTFQLGHPEFADAFEAAIARLLKAAFNSEADCKLLYKHFHVFSQAVPAAFLDALYEDLSKEVPVSLILFEGRAGFFHTDYHATSLLHTVSGLAEIGESTVSCVRILARLAEIAPEMSVSPKPSECLVNIFRVWKSWHPLDEAARMELLEVILDEFPTVGWQLVKDLLPKHHDSYTSGVNLGNRISIYTIPEVAAEEPYLADRYAPVVRLAIRHCGTDSGRWKDVLGMFWQHLLPRPEVIKEVLDLFVDNCVGLSEAERTPLWLEIRKEVQFGRRFPNSRHPIPDKVLGWFEEVTDRMRPESPQEELRHLFSNDLHNELVFENSEEYHVQERRLLADAATRLAKALSPKDLVNYANRVEKPNLLGQALSLSDVEFPVSAFFAEGFDTLSEKEREFLRFFIKASYYERGRTWADEHLSQAWLSSLPNQIHARMLASIPVDDWVRSRLEAAGEEVMAHYFADPGLWWVQPSESLLWQVEQLVNRGHSSTAFRLLSYNVEKFPGLEAPLVIRLLQTLDFSQLAEHGHSLHYELRELFRFLHKNGEEYRQEIIGLEFLYFKLLKDEPGDEKIVLWLFKELAASPALFADIVSYATIPDKYGSLGEVPEEERVGFVYGLSAHAILNEWDNLPGSTDDNNFDSETFSDWLKAAKAELVLRGRAKHGLRELAKVLSKLPSHSDGTWPSKAILPLLEKELLDSSYIEKVASAKYHGKGPKVFWGQRIGAEQKEQEELFLKQAENVSLRFPKVAKMLRAVAGCYKATASHYERFRTIDSN